MSIEELFCFVDDFCVEFMPIWMRLLLTQGIRKRQRSSQLVASEIMTILILFQQSHYRDFKTFYLNHVSCSLRQAFPQLVSYTRFVSLIPRVFVPLCIFLQSIQSTSEGIAFIDSTPIEVCHKKRTSQHKVFAGFAELGKTTKGWFYGFKLHIVINHQGELCAAHITPGNVDDRVPIMDLTKHLFGKLIGDKGYLGQELFEILLKKGIQLITGIKKNMKNKLMHCWDKILLRKRSLIESVNNQLKNVFQVQHTRHRSVFNGFSHMLCALIAFVFHPSKPSLKLSQQDLHMLQLNA
jgi:hypothetical protein